MAKSPGGEDAAARVAALEALQDAQLVERVLQGDAAAYGDLVTRHMRRAFSIAFRILGHREDAEDVVQDSFIRALERIDSLDRTRPFRPWLARIIVNQALNYRRSRTRRTTEEVPVSARSTTVAPDAAAERAQLRRRLTDALETLPDTQRTILQLADVEQFTSAEIAEVMDLADGTVRWHLHQARHALRGVLGPLKEVS